MKNLALHRLFQVKSGYTTDYIHSLTSEILFKRLAECAFELRSEKVEHVRFWNANTDVELAGTAWLS